MRVDPTMDDTSSFAGPAKLDSTNDTAIGHPPAAVADKSGNDAIKGTTALDDDNILTAVIDALAADEVALTGPSKDTMAVDANIDIAAVASETGNVDPETEDIATEDTVTVNAEAAPPVATEDAPVTVGKSNTNVPVDTTVAIDADAAPAPTEGDDEDAADSSDDSDSSDEPSIAVSNDADSVTGHPLAVPGSSKKSTPSAIKDNLDSIPAHFFIDDEDSDNDNGLDVLPKPIPVPKVTLNPADELISIGPVQSIVRGMPHVPVCVTIRGVPGMILDQGTYVCLKNRKVIGVIMETIGSMDHPYYAIGYSKDEVAEFEALGLEKNTDLFRPAGHSQFVLESQIRAQKSYDVSERHDDYGSEDEFFSADEEEELYKQAKKEAANVSRPHNNRKRDPARRGDAGGRRGAGRKEGHPRQGNGSNGDRRDFASRGGRGARGGRGGNTSQGRNNQSRDRDNGSGYSQGPYDYNDHKSGSRRPGSYGRGSGRDAALPYDDLDAPRDEYHGTTYGSGHSHVNTYQQPHQVQSSGPAPNQQAPQALTQYGQWYPNANGYSAPQYGAVPQQVQQIPSFAYGTTPVDPASVMQVYANLMAQGPIASPNGYTLPGPYQFGQPIQQQPMQQQTMQQQPVQQGQPIAYQQGHPNAYQQGQPMQQSMHQGHPNAYQQAAPQQPQMAYQPQQVQHQVPQSTHQPQPVRSIPTAPWDHGRMEHDREQMERDRKD